MISTCDGKKAGKKPQHETTLDGLTRLEEAVGDFLARFDAGELSPWQERLGDVRRGLELKMLACSLGPRYWNCTFANYSIYEPARQLPVIAALKKFAREMPTQLEVGGGLLLLGRTGTGKDHLLAALLKIAVAKHRLSAAWWDGGKLYDAIAEAIGEESYHRLQNRLIEPLILAISDPVPLRGNLTDSQLRRLRDIIDARYRKMKSTWITTNVDTTDDARSLLTLPLLERITDGSLQLFCDWPTYRKPREH